MLAALLAEHQVPRAWESPKQACAASSVIAGKPTEGRAVPALSKEFVLSVGKETQTEKFRGPGTL